MTTEPDSGELWLPHQEIRKRDEGLSSKLRPSDFDSFVNQKQVVEVIKMMILGAEREERSVDHILLHGPPGLGKTTLARIVGKTGYTFRTGGRLNSIKELTTSMQGIPKHSKHVFIIDEIHSMHRKAQEELYNLLEDGYIRDEELQISVYYKWLTVIGTTTDKGSLPAPLLDRFGYIGWLVPYALEDMISIINRSVVLFDLEFEEEKQAEIIKDIASRSRGIPRLGNKLLRRISDFGRPITKETVVNAFKMLGIDDLGLSDLDRSIMMTILGFFKGGPVGLNTLCQSLGADERDFRLSVEPYLTKMGLMSLSNRGRSLTEKGKELASKWVLDAAKSATAIPITIIDSVEPANSSNESIKESD